MFPTKREQLILNYLNEHELATTQFLSELVNVSITTVRRDLNAMHKKGVIIKTHGGAKKITSLPLCGLGQLQVADAFLLEKEEIARVAATLISPKDAIFIGAGKTCTLLAEHLKGRENLTVVTTNVDVINVLAASDVSMILLGGDVHVGTNYIETLGEYTLELMNKMYFDKVFFTTNGVDLDFGYSINSRNQIPLYEHLISNCNRSYALIDYSKFNHRAFTQLFRIDQLPNIISDSKIPKEYVQYYKNHNINVFL